MIQKLFFMFSQLKQNLNRHDLHNLEKNKIIKKYTNLIISVFLLVLLFFILLSIYYHRYVNTFFFSGYCVFIVLYYYNSNFKNFIIRFNEDRVTIFSHYKTDFFFFYWLFLIFKIIISVFYFFYFYLFSKSQIVQFENIFYIITYICIFIAVIDLLIIFYIIFYKNKPVKETAATVIYYSVVKIIPIFGVLHVSSNVPIISPNPVSNFYHKYTFFGRGYGAWSSGQLIQIDYLKTHLGSKFNYKEIIDDDYMIDPQKLKNYFEKNNLNFTQSLETSYKK